MAQIATWDDRDLERLYQYGRVPLIRLPGRPPVSVDIGDADLSRPAKPALVGFNEIIRTVGVLARSPE
jgi:type I restriction enzyme R subunit